MQLSFQGLSVGLQRGRRATPQFPVAHSTAGLHHTRGVEVIQVHQHTRRQAVEVAGAVRLVGQHAGQAQALLAHLDAVAHLQFQCGEQPGLGPGFAGSRAGAGAFHAVGLGGAAQLAAQRIGIVGGLDAGQLDAQIGGDDAGKLHHAGVIEAQRVPRGELFGAGRRAAAEHQVGAEEFAGAQQHGAVQTCAEVADGGTGRHGDQHGAEQHAQLAGAQVAQQLAGRQGKQAGEGNATGHQGSSCSISRPPSRRICRRQRWARRWSWVTSTRVVPRS